MHDWEITAGQLYDALKAITEHFEDVMDGPLIRGQGVTFANGVQGIPTIAAAREMLALYERVAT